MRKLDLTVLDGRVEAFNKSQDVFKACVEQRYSNCIDIRFYRNSDGSKIPVWVYAVPNSEEHKSRSTRARFRNVFAGEVDQERSDADSLELAAIEFLNGVIACKYIQEELPTGETE
jgi:hypothetical protein